MQATKPIDEVVTGDRVVLDDGRPAVVRHNDAYVTRIGPSATMVMHRLVTVADDGSTVYVEARWRDPVSVIIPPHHRDGKPWDPARYNPDNSDTWSCNGLGADCGYSHMIN